MFLRDAWEVLDKTGVGVIELIVLGLPGSHCQTSAFLALTGACMTDRRPLLLVKFNDAINWPACFSKNLAAEWVC